MKPALVLDLDTKLRRVQECSRFLRKGTVQRVVGLAIESKGPFAAVGELCHLVMPNGSRRPLEVVGFNETSVFLMPLGELEGISPGLTVTAEGRAMSVPVGHQFLGRIVNGLCQPLDGKGPIAHDAWQPLMGVPPAALSRPRITDILPLGVRAVDGPITCGRGQRIGIFGGSGVGKSTLLGMFAKFARSDVNVIALVGERGREVREFMERDLGPEGLKRSVVVVVTSDEAPLLRVKGALAACAMAEYFRDQGKNVLLMLDSITRICVAQREIGLAIGEPPTTRGYTPSVFSNLPRILERAGTSPKGSITGLFTILVEGDDMTEPVADAVRAILDGHIVLSREMAGANQYPAIDVLNSQSRLFMEIVRPEHRKAAATLRNVMASYHRARDLLDVGAYVNGSNPEVDRAIALWGRVQRFLQQVPEEHAKFEDTVKTLQELAGAA